MEENNNSKNRVDEEKKSKNNKSGEKASPVKRERESAAILVEEENNNANPRGGEKSEDNKLVTIKESTRFPGRLWTVVSLFFGAITIEPGFFLFYVGYGIYDIAAQEIYIEKTCRLHIFWRSE